MTLHEPPDSTVEGAHLTKYIRYVLVDFLNAECICIILCIKTRASDIRRGDLEVEN